jgi:outer membrane protein OmpA-like peptidoglycan-associated protein
VKELEARLALHSVYFPTAQPTPANTNGGLVKSQQATLTALAADFKKYLQSRPEAHLILEGHADPRGSAEFNQALSERRVNRTKNFLVEQGVPAGNIDTKAFGAQQQLTADQVKQSLDQASDITPGEKQRITRNMRTIILASNRRVDVTLSTTGQESVRQFPFNAADALTLIGGREKPATAAPKKPMTKKKDNKPKQ